MNTLQGQAMRELRNLLVTVADALGKPPRGDRLRWLLATVRNTAGLLIEYDRCRWRECQAPAHDGALDALAKIDRAIEDAYALQRGPRIRGKKALIETLRAVAIEVDAKMKEPTP